MTTITITNIDSFHYLIGRLEDLADVYEDDGEDYAAGDCASAQDKLEKLGLGTHQVDLTDDERDQLQLVIEDCTDYPDEFNPSHVQIS